MRKATLKDLEWLYETAISHRKQLPYIRKDYIKKAIEDGRVLINKSAFLIWLKYRRKTKIAEGFYTVPGDVIIKEIVESEQGSGAATEICTWLKETYPNVDLWAVIRKDNPRSIRFHEKNGWLIEGKTSWSKGTIPGVVTVKRGRECLLTHLFTNTK